MPDKIVESKFNQGIKVRIFRLPNNLLVKITGNTYARTNLQMKSAGNQKVRVILDLFAQDYPDWVTKFTDQLLELSARAVDTPEMRKEIFANVHAIAHEIKGQGETFGYTLLSNIADQLVELTTKDAKLSNANCEIMKAHIEAIRMIIKRRLKGLGGDLGDKIQADLDYVVEKNSQLN